MEIVFIPVSKISMSKLYIITSHENEEVSHGYTLSAMPREHLGVSLNANLNLGQRWARSLIHNIKNKFCLHNSM